MKEFGFLKALVRKAKVRRVLEIGTFTGDSALAMAEALPEDGMIITCEINPGLAAVARRRFERSPHGHKVEVRLGPARETLAALSGPFDMILIDADTENYSVYYEGAVALLSEAGMLLIDNMQGSLMGSVDPNLSPAARAIQELSRTIASDTRVTAEFVAVRDGVVVITRRSTPAGFATDPLQEKSH
jgi:predicted O-methyltransferase YrrM